MQGRTVLVTGSTGGIGLATARGLARLGARVLLVGRDPARAAEAATALRAETGRDVTAFHTDVSHAAGLAHLVTRVGEHCDRLDVLVNNAGVNRAHRELNPEGVELDFAVNVLAPFTLARALLPLLRRSDDARVVNLTGGMPGGPIDPHNLQGERRYIGVTFSQYNHSKTALMAMSRVMARDIAPHGVHVNVVYPGHAYTPGNRAMPAAALPALYRPLAPVLRLLGPVVMGESAVIRAARSSIHAASSPEMAGVTDRYLDTRCRPTPWPAGASDPAGQRAVWELCERLAR
ncbi:NAD(P)-dependent dehydrogenase (short-subunit alcohol dehydrogenase family) [Stackebrandtia albiflava]|uniref:NAD(P)-dependent dehydrogenase (Short-subunit alcohol dehydrogenase family) n=1 Tax=Stackebrandtia albiflava TaxID=406432 RepID=A0A562V1B2_9ACTN|nr:SDR family NAD(P)-dependent oxidoreductase [Stackebrandtia albiflava]TWJ11668.1 NAD(P)-dependent dehydrogenase (short-subunit alcohol dehydrogenase family) [Stackebrandtia albiflava]